MPSPQPRRPLYLEELRIGQQFTTGTHQLAADEIIAFARIYDAQPFHIDDAAARETMFGGLAASGWHTAALSMRLLVESGVPFAGGIIGGGGELSWPRPTRPGDTLQVVVEILDITPSRSRPDRGMVTVRNETRNQHGEPVQVFVAKLVVPRRTPA
ncbi:MAG: MaoC family dehydratase [Rhodospirillales bacterium]|nr:MaoC family dehydratase [Rhodospirillales bacterium]MDE2574595.1 MaoC family dehydratase [Rhodospirillales bacterium]